jgi:tRNA G18 (ribose-2'-O)-methylase SpoU
MNTNSVVFFKEQNIDSLPDNTNIILAVWEIGNPSNIGNIIRLAHNVGAIKVLFVNDNKNFNKLKVKKTAGFSYDQMDWEFISENDFFEFTEKEFELVILETCSGAKNIYTVNLPQKVFILAGSESRGIPDEIIEKAKHKVYIPMHCACKSMNVSHALAVASFEWARQMIMINE